MLSELLSIKAKLDTMSIDFVKYIYPIEIYL